MQWRAQVPDGEAMKRFLIAGLLVLAGCAARQPAPSPQVVELNRYVSTQRPLAQKGEIKWSAYYDGVRDRLISAGANYENVHLASQLFYGAQQFEKGEISQEEFERRQKYARVQMQDIAIRDAEERRAQEQANVALALQMMQNRPAIAPLTLTPIAPVNVQAPAPIAPVAATAFRTGNQQVVQTITNKSGWSCEYNYASRTFWRTFVGVCPQSVPVQ
jgi:hypothetical protein